MAMGNLENRFCRLLWAGAAPHSGGLLGKSGGGNHGATMHEAGGIDADYSLWGFVRRES